MRKNAGLLRRSISQRDERVGRFSSREGSPPLGGAVALRVAAAMFVAHSVLAQSKPVTLYYQNVPLFSQGTNFSEGGASDFNRFRIMTEPVFGDFYLRVAYEQVVTFRQNAGQDSFVGSVPGGAEWLDLQWTILPTGNEGEDVDGHVRWTHRLDRLQLGWTPTDAVELSVGRQAVSWATTLFLTPADPFSPFNPADPFREFRAGVDSARIRIYPGPLSEIDVVVRPTTTELAAEELTTLGRGLTTWRGWEISGWGGSLYGDVTGAFGAAGSLGSYALRGEGVVREIDGEVVFRGTIGFDRRFNVKQRDLYVVAEYQHDGLAASTASDYVELSRSDPFRRGELQVLGRDEAALQASYQLHPLWSLATIGLWNVSDGSFLVSPSFTFSASDEATVSGGLFVGFGDGNVGPESPLPSEYGAFGATAYVSVSLFF